MELLYLYLYVLETCIVTVSITAFVFVNVKQTLHRPGQALRIPGIGHF
jgi:hypothetical protein